ncbi:hypothetical protein M7I_7037 [Glarea lozoyensis 74030]|uniref:Rhodopsin domain-containing protein n=1 Tax=Glarea lozoyensis (strain ATCC 74030 / MF5533) TaxID=1104152 RepID=H0EW76_GLAL7|nr:hypothetical protein M7I_7037 [Glarea lozoyensis 74030]
MGLYAKFTPGEVAAAGVVFPFIGTILVALRTRARLRKLKKLAVEDYLVYVALVLHLHITTRKKIGIACIFGMGILTVVASIIRAVFYVNLLNAEKTELATFDPNMLNTNGIYWMLVETGLALIAVNLPLLYGTSSISGRRKKIQDD